MITIVLSDTRGVIICTLHLPQVPDPKALIQVGKLGTFVQISQKYIVRHKTTQYDVGSLIQVQIEVTRTGD